MNRRQRLKEQLRGGGTTAPMRRAPKRRRGGEDLVRRSPGPRGQQLGDGSIVPKTQRKGGGRERIKAGLAKNRPARQPGGGRRAGLAQNRAQAGIGAQLTRRVESGAIDQDQANRVARERALLEERLGPEWRTKLYGDRGYVQRTRKALAEDPDDPQLLALNVMLMKRRKSFLDQLGASTTPSGLG